MPFEDITLVNASAENVVYKMVGAVGADGRVVRKDLTQPLEEPVMLSLGHATSGKGSMIQDRHLARIDQTVLDADGITAYNVTGYIVLAGHRKVLTGARVWDILVQLKSLHTTEAAVTAFLQGQL